MSETKLPTAEEVAMESLKGNVGPTYNFLVNLATYWRLCATGGWKQEQSREAAAASLLRQWEAIKAYHQRQAEAQKTETATEDSGDAATTPAQA